MKLILENFKCYKGQKTFDISENSCTLICGKSGIGKTTIFDAISFALYGTGNKLQNYGEKSCKVILHYKELIISRTKCPNRLVLENTDTNLTLEDDPAQSIIDKRFGKFFGKVAIIKQNSLDGFIQYNSQSKLEFLQDISLSELNLDESLVKLKNLQKDREDRLNNITGQIHTLNYILEKEVEEPNFPIRTKNKELSIKNNQTRIKNSKIKIKKLQKELQLINNRLIDTNIFLTKESLNKQELSINIENKHKLLLLIKDIDKKLLEDNYNKNINLIKKCDEHILLLEQYNKYNNSLERYNTVKNMIQLDLDKRKKELEDILEQHNSIHEKDLVMVSELEKKLEVCLTNKQLSQKYNKYIDIFNRYNNMLNSEKERLISRKDKLENILKDYDAEDTTQQISDISEYLENKKKLQKIKKQIDEEKGQVDMNLDYDDLLKNIENKLKQTILDIEQVKLSHNTFKCPDCNTFLRLNGKVLEKTDYKENRANISELEKLLKKLEKDKINYQQLRDIKFRLNQLIYTHLEPLQKNITEFKEQYEIEGDLKEYLSELIDLQRTNQKYQNELDTINNSIKNNDFGNVIKSLSIELEKCEKIDKEQIDFELIESEKNIREELEYTNNRLEEYNKIFNEHSIITNKLLSPNFNDSSLSHLKNEIDKLENSASLKNIIDFEIIDKKDILKLEYEELKSKLDFYNNTEKDIEKYDNIIDKYNNIIENDSLEYTKKYPEIENFENLLNNLNNKKDELEIENNNLQKELDEYEQLEKKIEKYLEDNTKWDEYINRKKLLQELKQEENELHFKIASCKIIKEKIKETEIKMVRHTIGSINECMSEYLERFFEDPISVEIYEKKGEKKYSIDVRIEYRNNECSLNNLSGGELQRLNLACNLAICDYLQVPFILMDEVCSNLDSITTDALVNGIQEVHKDKTIVLIAHQVVSGVFDNEILLT